MRISSIPAIYRNISRWGEIVAVLSKYELANWIARAGPNFAKDFIHGPGGPSIARLNWPQRVRMALTELGPTFIKLGQALSTRPDVVGLEMAEELQNLQTNVNPDEADVVRTLIETELGRPMEEVFRSFEDVPVAAASIGQVHIASLQTGESVAVKVQRFGIERKVEVDLEILTGLAQLAERIPEWECYHPREIAREFQRTMRRELDFGRELRNMQTFERNLKRLKWVRVPRTFPQYSTSRVLTMEMLDGVKLANAKDLIAGKSDLDMVARRGAEMFLEMIFVDGFYHADPHPGNVLIMADDTIGLLDFGMVGRIDEHLHEQIEEALAALMSQDTEHLTSVIIRAGSPAPGLDRASLEVDLADFVMHYADRPLQEFDLSGALREITQIIRRYRIKLPARISMLIKMLVTLEGSGQALNPEFNLMEVLRPYRRRLMMRRFSPMRRWRKLRRMLGEIDHLLQSLPRSIDLALEQVQSGRFHVRLDHRGLEPAVNRLVLGLFSSALFIGASWMISSKVPPVFGDLWLIGAIEQTNELSLLGVAAMGLSGFMGLRLWRAIHKSGKLEEK